MHLFSLFTPIHLEQAWGCEEWTGPQGGMRMKISSLLCPGAGNILISVMGLMGREVVAAFQREQGLGYILHREPFWVEFPRKQQLLHSVSWHQCMFCLKMLKSTHHAGLGMQHNGRDPSVFVSAMEKPWRHWCSPSLRNLLCDFISLWFLVVEVLCPLCACHDVMRFWGATWIPKFWEAFKYWNIPDSMSSYDSENRNTQHIRKKKKKRDKERKEN